MIYILTDYIKYKYIQLSKVLAGCAIACQMLIKSNSRGDTSQSTCWCCIQRDCSQIMYAAGVQCAREEEDQKECSEPLE